LEAEQAELAWLLSSGVLGRSNNLARMLTFICERYFEGREDEIKEHTIAVKALGRRPDFDPHVDTIVRVTAHSLRKRLQEIYQNEGADRPMHVVIPAGNYVPSFVPNTPSKPDVAEELDKAAEPEAAPFTVELPPTPPDPGVRRGFTQAWLVPAVFMLVVAILCGGYLLARRQAASSAQMAAVPAISLPAVPVSGAPGGVRVLLGPGRKKYVDHSGNTWSPGACDGGNGVQLPEQRIAGTEDAYLYLGGIRGISHCSFPVEPGFYELHFHFAETSNLEPARRATVLSINGRPNIGFDVVDDAGGDGIATSLVMTGVHPENDGAIHVDFISEITLLNAVEILPAPSEALLPIRIVAGSSAFTDPAKQVWLSDRYFSGGRHGQMWRAPKSAELSIYANDRVGHFRYTIPVVPREKYRVRLFFREPWYGKGNDAAGGAGSRVFNVWCNGMVLLKDFDVLAEAGPEPIVKTFDNVQASAEGKIELSFTPVTNYAFVNAIEVIPEPEPRKRP
jgi:hypothetical protein